MRKYGKSFSCCPAIFVNIHHYEITIFLEDLDSWSGDVPKTLIYPNFELMSVWRTQKWYIQKYRDFIIYVDWRKLPDDMKMSLVFILWICSILTKWTQLYLMSQLDSGLTIWVRWVSQFHRKILPKNQRCHQRTPCQVGLHCRRRQTHYCKVDKSKYTNFWTIHTVPELNKDWKKIFWSYN